jgi:hypothetical protein
MKVGLLLLCHEKPATIAARLTSPFFAGADVKVYIHYDASRGEADRVALEAAIPAGVQFAFVKDRVHCRWGSLELVTASQRMMRDALADPDFRPDYVLLLSASCVPIRPFSSLREFLVRRNGQEFIQAKDISKGAWVRGGLEAERYALYFPFDWTTSPRAFDLAVKVQRRLRLRRKPMPGLTMHFGSQWFCLTRNTADHVVKELDRPDMQAFLRHTWIPDEFAIQSIVASHVKRHLVADVSLTYYEFTTEGVPLVLDNGHFEHLLRQPFFLARKVAPGAKRLEAQLEAHVRGTEYDLSYFDHVGVPTPDFQKWEVEVRTDRSRRARVGTLGDFWRGVSDLNQRPYYVLYGASRAYALALTEAARGGTQLPIFDYLFDKRSLVPAAERTSFRGIQVGDLDRRDYDPSAFLYEIANLDATTTSAFAVDPAQGGWISHFVLWDPNAVLISCDPEGTTAQQRADAACRDLEGGRDVSIIEATLEALAHKRPLPQDVFSTARLEAKHHCRFLSLQAIPPRTTDATLRALRAASLTLDPKRFYGAR